MSEQITVELPDDVAQELGELDNARVNEVICNAVREALGLGRTAEERRDELRERMGLSDNATEELADESLSAAERKQAELREKIRRGR